MRKQLSALWPLCALRDLCDLCGSLLLKRKQTTKDTKVAQRTLRVSRLAFRIALVATIALLLMAASDTSKRFSDLGHRMMCTCGCNQILLECNHVGCMTSDTMRAELAAGLDKGDNDSLILQSFVQKYGNTVIAAPLQSGFGLVAWVTPFAALAVATWLVVVMVKRWQRRPAAAAAGASTPEIDALLGVREVDALRARARQETEI